MGTFNGVEQILPLSPAAATAADGVGEAMGGERDGVGGVIGVAGSEEVGV